MKFWALVVLCGDVKLKRMWMSESTAVLLLKDQKDIKIYNGATQQEAVVVEDGILWKTVEEVDKI